MEHLKGLLSEIDYIVVSKELHENGDPHLHAVIIMKKKMNIKSQTFFDIEAFHPNVQSAKKLIECVKYVKKDGEFIEEGTPPKTKTNPKKLTPLNEVTTEELFNYCVQNKVGYGYYKEELSRRHTVNNDITEETPVKGEMIWYLNCLSPDYSKCAVLVGSSGCGKTTWAKKNSMKPALFVSHLDTLKKFKPNYHKTIIFDDMKFTHLPEQAQIHLVDMDDPREIHIRYGTVQIPSNVWKIFTCNERPFSHHPAIDRRIREINI